MPVLLNPPPGGRSGVSILTQLLSTNASFILSMLCGSILDSLPGGVRRVKRVGMSHHATWIDQSVHVYFVSFFLFVSLVLLGWYLPRGSQRPYQCQRQCRCRCRSINQSVNPSPRLGTLGIEEEEEGGNRFPGVEEEEAGEAGEAGYFPEDSQMWDLEAV